MDDSVVYCYSFCYVGVELPPTTPANQVSFGTLGNPPVAAGTVSLKRIRIEEK